MPELLIKNGLIVDGTGAPAYPGHLIVKDGQITAIAKGEVPAEEGRQVIDAGSQAVAPGFIDLHSHSDLTILANPRAESALHQGITTEITGVCGWSMAPIHHYSVEKLGMMLVEGLGGVKRDNPAIDWTWTTMAEYLDHVRRRGSGTNFGSFVGQSMVRAYVIGTANRTATHEEVVRMRRLVEQALEDGAFGLSTGRAYNPGRHAGTDEIVELTRPLGYYGGLYTSHIASESKDVVAATEEVAEIGQRARCAVNVSHQKVCGKANWGRAGEPLSVMERAQARGIDMSSDIYPWTFTQLGNVARWLPLWAREGSTDAACARLRDPQVRAKLAAEVDPESGRTFADILGESGATGLVHCRHTHQYEGMELAEIATATGKSLLDTLCDLLADNEMMIKAASLLLEDDVIAILKHPLSMVGTDSFDIDVPLPEEEVVHPRHYGTYPQVLGRYVRELKALTLEEAIRKMTSRPASRVGLTDRGRIREGAWADLVIFDPTTIGNTSTAAEPASFPTGIAYVLVNGQVAVDHNRCLGAQSGQVLHRN